MSDIAAFAVFPLFMAAPDSATGMLAGFSGSIVPRQPGRGGNATLSINGEKAGEGRIEKTIPGKFGFDEQDIGMDLSSAVSEDYKSPFKFTGTIKKVSIDINK